MNASSAGVDVGTSLGAVAGSLTTHDVIGILFGLVGAILSIFLFYLLIRMAVRHGVMDALDKSGVTNATSYRGANNG